MKDRIQRVIDVLGITATRLADEIQVQRSGISHILSGRNQPSYDFLTRLLNRYPDIDARWLITGSGDIYNKKPTPVKPTKAIIEESSAMVRSEDKLSYGVTNVNQIVKVVLLHQDGTFEVYTPGNPH